MQYPNLTSKQYDQESQFHADIYPNFYKTRATKTNPQYSTRMPLTYNAQITMESCMQVTETLSI